MLGGARVARDGALGRLRGAAARVGLQVGARGGVAVCGVVGLRVEVDADRGRGEAGRDEAEADGSPGDPEGGELDAGGGPPVRRVSLRGPDATSGALLESGAPAPSMGGDATTSTPARASTVASDFLSFTFASRTWAPGMTSMGSRNGAAPSIGWPSTAKVAPSVVSMTRWPVAA